MKEKVLIVSAPYYKDIVERLVEGAKIELESNDINVHQEFAPGAFEIPFVINNKINNYDGFVAIGCIIRGETYHFELLANEVTRKIMDLSVSSNKPIGFGIITCENIDQAIKRSGEINKGIEAARACIKMIRGKLFGFGKF